MSRPFLSVQLCHHTLVKGPFGNSLGCRAKRDWVWLELFFLRRSPEEGCSNSVAQGALHRHPGFFLCALCFCLMGALWLLQIQVFPHTPITWLLWASRAGGNRIAVWVRPIMTYCLSKQGTLRAEHGWHSIGQERTGTHKMLIASSGVLSFVCPVPCDSSLLGHPVNLSHSVSAPPFRST